jgi:CRP/FNR family transcriptional regulator, polysaccharide utilization system transcription regulator
MTQATDPVIPKCATCDTRHGSVFCDLDTRDLEVLGSTKSCRSYSKGQTIYLDGEHPAGLYCIHEGNVKVFKSGRDGKEQILRFARPGDIIGYRALLSGEPHSNSATAIADAQICYIPRAAFFTVSSESVSLNGRIFSLLSQELRQAQTRIVDMAQRPLRERVAETLLFLRESFGLEGDGRTLNVRLTRREISDVVGSATESVIRSLAELKSEGLIDIKGKSIEILNAKSLVRAAAIED